MLEKTKGARSVLNLSPDRQYTRHSEGAFLRLRDGRIFFAYSRFTMPQDPHECSWGDWAPASLAGILSEDEGERWSEPTTLISCDDLKPQIETDNLMSVSLLRMQNGDIGMFYLAKELPNYRPLLSRSSDEGKTWYSRTEIVPANRQAHYVINNDRVERLASGRLLFPVAMHRAGRDPERPGLAGLYSDQRGLIHYFYSDDDGVTWHESPDRTTLGFAGSESELQEPGLIQLKNGVVWAYFRTDRMYQYQSFSIDNGLHWTACEPSRFTSPCSPMKVARRPDTGVLYSVWNPIPNYNGRQLGPTSMGRTPLVYAMSHDEGASWSDCRIIEDDPACGYCYPSVFFTQDGAMLIAYCSGGPQDGGCLAKLSVMKVPLEA